MDVQKPIGQTREYNYPDSSQHQTFQIQELIRDPEELKRFKQFEKDHIDEFRETFDVFDKNKDGLVSKSEMQAVLRATGQNPTDEELQRTINSFDLNTDGKVEFLEFFYVAFKMYQTPDEMTETLRRAFKIFDKDCNGLIDAAEFRNIVTNLGGDPLQEKEIMAMMDVADTNKDGKIDYNEFCHLVVSNQ